MVYTSVGDPACYPGTEVLRNKAGVKDAVKLKEFELAMFLIRSEEDWPDRRYDPSHYYCLHRHLFEDVYAWAGEIRKILISKAGNWFCYPEHIEKQMTELFDDLTYHAWF